MVMAIGMRHTAVLVLGFVLLALVMACGDTATTPTGVSIPEPSPDIEATVEAHVAIIVARQGEKSTSTNLQRRLGLR
jgi:hypothetical protein